MKNPHLKLISMLACAGIVSAVPSCSYRHNESSPEVMAEHIEAYTAGVIKTTGTIRVVFKEAVKDSLPADCRIMKFTPNLKGEEQWDATGHILEFTPKKGQLKAGKTYFCKLHQGKVIPGAKDIVFSFKVAERAAEIQVNEVKISADFPGTAIVKGRVTLSEPVEDGKVTPELLTGSASWKTVTMKRIADDSYEFEISGLRRSSTDLDMVLDFHAEKIGFGNRSRTTVIIPGKNRLKLLSADLVDAVEPYISILFSDPLDDSQSLDGLVYIDEAQTLRLERDGSQVKLFFKDPGSRTLTLRIDQRIRSIKGNTLDEEHREAIRSPQIPPAVRLITKDGILPDEKGLKLHFKAVNLCAVDVSVIKIFSSNVLSFYQENSIDSSNDLRRYGRIVYKTTARLDRNPSGSLHQWQSYSIDLNKLFRQEKGAIYRIKLAFRQEYSMYEKGDSPANISAAQMTPEDEKSWDEGYDWYTSYYDYYTNEWDWRDRNDPSTPSYYMLSSRFPEINLASSNIGIIVKSADETRLWVTTSDLLSSEPLPGVKITAYNYQLLPVGEGYSDGNGFADISLKGKAQFIRAEKGNSVSHLRMRGHELSLSHFDVGGKKIRRGLKGHVYGERGVWRPGDTLHLTLVIEDKLHKLPESHPATMELYTPEGLLFGSRTLKEGRDGFYSFEIATAEDSPTGSWTAVFSVGGATFKHTVPIETVKPNRLKIKLATDRETLAAGDEAVISVESRWLTGPAAANLEGTIEMVLHNIKRPFPEYHNYTFTNPLSDYSSETLTRISFQLDGDGCATLSRKMPEAADAPGMLTADMICSISEPGGNANISSNTVRFSPFSHYVGIDLKENSFETDSEIRFKLVSVDADGRAISGRELEYKIFRLGWNWWWECDSNDLDRYVSGDSADLETSGTLNGAEDILFSVKYPDYGTFLILVKDTESGHTTGGVFLVDWPSWRGHSGKSDPGALSMLSFTTDKRSYEVGETATVYLPVSEGGHALVSFENATGVISRKWIRTSGSGETAWKFRITEDMAPNVYLHITLLQPHRQTLNDLPIRMYGVQNINVDNPESRLFPVIDCPDEVRPQAAFNVRVKEKNGRPMTYTLAIVDEGLLGLTGFRTPDLWAEMNAREALGVRTWDMYNDVVGAYAGRFTQVLSIGGDMALGSARKENRFNPVVKFLGPFTIEKGTATHRIDLPMYVGSVRVMVVAGHDGAYGNAEKDITVRSPLMLLSTLPRRLSMDEKVKLPVNVFALEPEVKDVQVKVEVSGPVKIDGQATKRLHFRETGDSLAVFSIEADKTKAGQATVKVTAEAKGCKAHETIHIDIVNPNPVKTESFPKMLSPGGQADFSWSGHAPAEGESAVLEITGFPSIDFTSAFEFVHNYRHLCTEQLSSNAFFLLYARQFLGEEDKIEAETLLPAIISHLVSRQRPDGGFAYWPGSRYSNSWATSMAGQVLIEAVRQGFPVQQSAIDSWIEFQKQSARNYRHSEEYNLNDLDQAYRLYTLALAKHPDMGAMNRLKESGDISLQARLRLAEAYAVAGKRESARRLTENALISIGTPSNGLGSTWHSTLRDEAMILDALAETGNIDKAMELAARVAEEFSPDNTSTQELAWVSRAMAALAKAVGSSVTDVSFRQSSGPERNISGSGSTFRQTLDYASGEIHVRNNSDASVYTHLSIRQQADSGEEVSPASNGVKVSVDWQTLEGNPLNIKDLKQGTEFRAVISVKERTGITTSESMALTFTAPSGWEIWNDRLFGGDDGCDYRDIRDNEIRWYFTLEKGSIRQFTVRLQAAYEGTFRLPEILCEDMYNADYRSNTASGSVCVSR